MEAGPIWGGPCGGRPYMGGPQWRPALYRGAPSETGPMETALGGGVFGGAPGYGAAFGGWGGLSLTPNPSWQPPQLFFCLFGAAPHSPQPPPGCGFGVSQCQEGARRLRPPPQPQGLNPRSLLPVAPSLPWGPAKQPALFFVAFWASPGDVGALFWVPQGDVGALSFSRGQVSVWLRRAPQRAAVILGGGFGGPERRKEDFGLPTPLIFQPPP